MNALEPGLALKVGEVTQTKAGQGKGRHTTSSAGLVALAMPDTYVADSRGMAAADLDAGFPDIAGPAAGCAFADCAHNGPGGCAVFSAAANDWFLRERLDSYRELLKEVG